jgi:hypothetical protein
MNSILLVVRISSYCYELYQKQHHCYYLEYSGEADRLYSCGLRKLMGRNADTHSPILRQLV